MTQALKTMETLEGTQSEEATGNFETEIGKLAPKVGLPDLTERERQILFRPVDAQQILIRPDGLVYMSWVEYSERLRNAFGLDWAMVPQGLPRLSGNCILWGFYLVVRGRVLAFAFGEAEYQPDNKRASWGDCCEMSKSNCLMRLCKSIGMCADLWRPSLVNEWKLRYAESFRDSKTGKTLWRKKSPQLQNNSIPQLQGDSMPAKINETNPRLNGHHPTAREVAGKIRDCQTLDNLKSVWSQHYRFMESLPKDESAALTQLKDSRKLMLNGRK